MNQANFHLSFEYDVQQNWKETPFANVAEVRERICDVTTANCDAEIIEQINNFSGTYSRSRSVFNEFSLNSIVKYSTQESKSEELHDIKTNQCQENESNLSEDIINVSDHNKFSKNYENQPQNLKANSEKYYSDQDVICEQFKSNELTQAGLINLDDPNYLSLLQNDSEDNNRSFTVEQDNNDISVISEYSQVRVKNTVGINSQQNEITINTSEISSNSELTSWSNSIVAASYRTFDNEFYLPLEDEIYFDVGNNETENKHRVQNDGRKNLRVCKFTLTLFDYSIVYNKVY